MKYKQIILLLSAILILFSCKPDSEEEDNTITITENDKGTYDDYDYELWMDDKAQGSMTIREKGTFSCSWESIVTGSGNFLARSGKKFDASKSHSDVGDISIKYNAKYEPKGNGISYLCVYGWTKAGNGAPLVEYYIVDNWGTNNRPPGSWTGAPSKGTITVDGETYDIYETAKTNQPSVEGTKNFQQYWSVNKARRSSGTISVSEHFKGWENIGMKLGNLYETTLCVEGYNSSGSAEITENSLSINGVPIK